MRVVFRPDLAGTVHREQGNIAGSLRSTAGSILVQVVHPYAPRVLLMPHWPITLYLSLFKDHFHVESITGAPQRCIRMSSSQGVLTVRFRLVDFQLQQEASFSFNLNFSTKPARSPHERAHTTKVIVVCFVFLPFSDIFLFVSEMYA